MHMVRRTLVGFNDFSAATPKEIFKALKAHGNALKKDILALEKHRECLSKLKNEAANRESESSDELVYTRVKDLEAIIDKLGYYASLVKGWTSDLGRMLSEMKTQIQQRHLSNLEAISRAAKFEEDLLIGSERPLFRLATSGSDIETIEPIYTKVIELLCTNRNLEGMYSRLKSFVGDSIEKKPIETSVASDHKHSSKKSLRPIDPPFPPGTEWNQLSLEMDDHKVLVKLNNHYLTFFEPIQIGMIDERTTEANSIWSKTLRRFAEDQGEVRIEYCDDRRGAFQQSVSTLRRLLREYFLIDSDPIIWKRGKYYYKALFNIRLYKQEGEDSKS